MDPQSIKAIHAGRGQTVVVTWRNGAESPVDLSGHLARFAVLAPLHDGIVPFSDVRVGDYGWSIHWTDDLEISADTLWRLALEQGAAWLTAWRKGRELSQESAAIALGLSGRMIRSYEAGRHLLPKMVRLACAGLDQERAA